MLAIGFGFECLPLGVAPLVLLVELVPTAAQVIQCLGALVGPALAASRFLIPLFAKAVSWSNRRQVMPKDIILAPSPRLPKSGVFSCDRLHAGAVGAAATCPAPAAVATGGARNPTTEKLETKTDTNNSECNTAAQWHLPYVATATQTSKPTNN